MGRLKKSDERQKIVDKRKAKAKELGITYSAYIHRLNHGWTEEQAEVCPKVEKAIRFYKGQSARRYVLEHGGKLSTYNYYIKMCPVEEAVELTLKARGKVKYYRDGMSLAEWCRVNNKNYGNEYKKEWLKNNKLVKK